MVESQMLYRWCLFLRHYFRGVFVVLYLLPNTFYEEQTLDLLLPHGLEEVLSHLDCIVGESERATRRYLIKVLKGSPIARSMPIYLLNEHSNVKEVDELGQKIVHGGTWGLVSDAGLPCIIDPGAPLISALHTRDFYDIVALGGASSLIMSLQLSGFSSQKFSFHGYLPHDQEKRLFLIRKLEQESKKDSMTQICIEVPYRTKQLFSELVRTLSPETRLCLAQEVGCVSQCVKTKSVASWKKLGIECASVPSVFLWSA